MEISELYGIFLKHPVVTTDSRNCPEDSIFFALKGASFNGNLFAQAAIEKGCAFAVVDEQVECPAGMAERMILVDDVLTTLQQLANYHRRQLGTRIIGVTGTNGKTTTKELIACVLQRHHNVLYTEGNLNNHIGVPRTLLRLTAEHDIAVIEMGANHPGEIKTLVNIVEPDCGIITNVGKAHLGGFGSFEGVIATKGELYDYLRENTREKIAFIDAGNEHLLGISEGLNLVKYGVDNGTGDGGVSVSGKVVECAPFLNFMWKAGAEGTEHEVNTHLIGDYNILNMLAAATIGLYFNVSEDDITAALSEYVPSNNRSQLTITDRNKLVVDAYNANPTSMKAALKNFAAMKVENKMAILGSMGELGDVSRTEHVNVVERLNAGALDNGPYALKRENIWLVGSEFEKIAHPFRQFTDVEAVKEAIIKEQPSGHCILIKGSNSQKLFQLPELL